MGAAADTGILFIINDILASWRAIAIWGPVRGYRRTLRMALSLCQFRARSHRDVLLTDTGVCGLLGPICEYAYALPFNRNLHQYQLERSSVGCAWYQCQLGQHHSEPSSNRDDWVCCMGAFAYVKCGNNIQASLRATSVAPHRVGDGVHDDPDCQTNSSAHDSSVHPYFQQLGDILHGSHQGNFRGYSKSLGPTQMLLKSVNSPPSRLCTPLLSSSSSNTSYQWRIPCNPSPTLEPCTVAAAPSSLTRIEWASEAQAARTIGEAMMELK